MRIKFDEKFEIRYAMVDLLNHILRILPFFAFSQDTEFVPL